MLFNIDERERGETETERQRQKEVEADRQTEIAKGQANRQTGLL